MDTQAKLGALALCVSKEADRASLLTPFLLDLDSLGRMAVATNGHVVLAFPADAELEASLQPYTPSPKDERTNPEKLATRLHEILTKGPGVACTLGALRSWAAAEPGVVPTYLSVATPEKCQDCNDERMCDCRACNNRGESTVYCDDDLCGGHYVDCCACDGRGSIPCRACNPAPHPRYGVPVRKGRLGVALVNRNLVYQVVRDLPEGPITIAVQGSEGVIVLRGDGWVAAVMPMRIAGSDSEPPPAFEPLVERVEVEGGL